MRLVTHRARVYHHWWTTEVEAMHGHAAEYVVETVYVLLAVAQLAVCPGFYATASLEFYTAACWVFAVTSAITVLLTINVMYEVHTSSKVRTVTIAGMGANTREYLESLCYVLASIMFAVGCIMYIPDVGKGREHAIYEGTVLFSIGSGAFVLAAFINGVSHKVPDTGSDDMTVKLGVAALGCAELGGASFFAGSLFFFPQLSDGTCQVENSWVPVDVGTDLFLVGCALYLVAAILNMISMNNKAMRHVDENDTKSKTETEQDKLDPLPTTMGELQAVSPPEEDVEPAVEICPDLLEAGKAPSPAGNNTHDNTSI